MKIKQVEMYSAGDIPDHIVAEIEALSIEMGKLLFDTIMNNNPSIVLGALGWMHAAITNQLVIDSDEAINNAAYQQAKALYNNINHCRAVRKQEQKDNERNGSREKDHAD